MQTSSEHPQEDDIQDASDNGNDMLEIPKHLLKNISSPKTIGKLMSLWMFVKDKIMSDDDLQLVLNNGDVIHGSNLIELIRFAIMHHSVTVEKPVGYKEFHKLLSSLHVPKGLVKQNSISKKKKTKIEKTLYIKRKAVNGVPGSGKFRKLESF